MDGNRVPMAARATSNGEMDAATLPARLEELGLSQDMVKLTAEPQRMTNQDAPKGFYRAGQSTAEPQQTTGQDASEGTCRAGQSTAEPQQTTGQDAPEATCRAGQSTAEPQQTTGQDAPEATCRAGQSTGEPQQTTGQDTPEDTCRTGKNGTAENRGIVQEGVEQNGRADGNTAGGKKKKRKKKQKAAGSSGKKEDVTASSGKKEDATAGPGKKEDTTSSPGKKEDATAGPGKKEDATAGPGKKEDATAGPGKKEDATAGPGKKEDATAGQGKKEETAPGPGKKEEATPGSDKKDDTAPGPGKKDDCTLGSKSTGGDSASQAESESAPLTLRWHLVDDSTDDAEQPPLTFPADMVAREASNKRWRPQGPTKKMMESYHIYQIKKPPSHHKNAKYVCRVCELHWDSLPAVQKHVRDQRHVDNTRRHQELTAVHTLPEPTAAQTARLSELLSAVYTEHGLTRERLRERRRAADQLRDALREGLEQVDGDAGYRVEVFGSSRHGCGLNGSDLDVALLPAEESTGAAQLTQAIQLLQDSELFTEVTHDFHSWIPHVRCVHAASGQPCQVALGAERDVQLARLVELYTALDERTAPLAVGLRHLARICEMDRPHAGSLPPSAFVLMTIYYLQQCEPPVLPVLHQMTGQHFDDEHPQELDYEAAAAATSSWRSENTSDLGTLWLHLLRFYALELTNSEVVVSIRQREPVTRTDKGWNSKKISIEDPVQSRRNISRSISCAAVADVIVDRLRAACLLFGVPRTAAGAAVRLVAGRGPPPPDADARMVDRLADITREELEYRFDEHLLCGETSMPVVCSVCQKTGHLADNCPTLEVPPAEPLQQPSPQQTQLMDRICTSVFKDWAPPAEEYHIRQSMLFDIENFIRHQAFPSARLTLFGSSCNGFGFRDSDLDICMTFDDCSDPQTLDQPEIILKLASTLNRLRSVCNVIPISTAKVPIVKFTDRRSRLEGDISLYNTLAQHNTLLLHTYAKLDSRARILGYMVKLMAKICDICDASRGSLSSYAYTLMLIYYLQRCRPAVLPVLQQLDADSRAPRLIDGADVGFFTELERLPKMWPEAGKNTCSVGELWFGFLRFYGEHFDFERNVVCIRRMETLTKFEKLWNGAFIAIEDPFLLSHNLGGGVRRKMASFIRRTLLLWRLHHLRPTPNTLPHGYRDFRAFLMSEEYLCEGPPPNAGGCHACGRIGHWAADCPRRRRRPPPAAGKQPARGTNGHRPARSPTKADGPARSPTKADGPARSPTKADGPARSPTKADGPARSPSKADGPARSPTKAEAQARPQTRSQNSRVAAVATIATEGEGDSSPTADGGPDVSVISDVLVGPVAEAEVVHVPAVEKKPRKRPRRRKPDRAAMAMAVAAKNAEPVRTVVFYNSNHVSGGTAAPDVASV